MIHQIINDEKFTNIQRAQAGLSKIFRSAQKTASIYRVMKNDKPMGVLVPNDLWQSFTEDIEALSSPNYRRRIAKARRGKKRISSAQAKKILGV